MKKNLIYDDGVLRNCEYNKARIGFLRTWRHFHGYYNCFMNLKTYIRNEFIEDIKGLIGLVVYILIFPIVPFVIAYFDYKRSKYLVGKELAHKIDGLHIE
jgi:hypothetical protein